MENYEQIYKQTNDIVTEISGILRTKSRHLSADERNMALAWSQAHMDDRQPHAPDAAARQRILESYWRRLAEIDSRSVAASATARH